MHNSRVKTFIYAVSIVISVFLLNVVVEIVGGDITKFLEDNWNLTYSYRLIYSGVICIIALAVLFIVTWKETNTETETTPPKTQTNPQNIEPDVKEFFEYLKKSYQARYANKLDGRLPITLEVSDDFDAENPFSITEQFGENASKGEAIEIISSIFEEDGRLLIAGNARVGKTVLLLKLAVDLLDKVEDVKKEPFPVIFNLASWSDKYEYFGDWLKSILVSGYGLSENLAKKLLQDRRIILFLDGLDELARNEEDEVAAEKRAKCLTSLNDYLNDDRKGVICSRIDEFLLMKKQENQDAPVEKKVRVLNLTKDKVIKTLKDASNGEEFKYKASAKNILKLVEKEENKNLLEILRTPFYYTTALEVFDKPIIEQKEFSADKIEIENYLNEKYIQRKFDETPNPNNFKRENSLKWLKWLAGLMEKKQLVIFELADLQPTDLKKKWIHGLVVGLVGGLSFGLFIGLFIGLVFGLFFGLVFGFDEIKMEDNIQLDISRLFLLNFDNRLFFGLIGGLFIGLLFGLIVGLFFGLFFGLFVGLFVGLFFGLKQIKIIKGFAQLETPYQRIFGGAKINLIFSLIVSGVFLAVYLFITYYLLIADNNPKDLFILIAVFFYFILLIATETVLFKYSALHLALCLEKVIPLKYATFLDYAADAGILEKTGGHWRFRHQNLQEYIAELPTDE